LRCLSSAALFWAYALLCKFIFNFGSLILHSYWSYQGFYKGDPSLLVQPSETWDSVLGSPLLIAGDYQLSASSQILADPLLVLHFVLVSINAKGNPARIISEMLSGYLPDQSFAFEEIIFDLATDELVLTYTNAIANLVHTLEGWVFKSYFIVFLLFLDSLYLYCSDAVSKGWLIIITNHSQDDTGDLYIGSDLCASVDEVDILTYIVSILKLITGILSS
jgi:hypothetical protein